MGQSDSDTGTLVRTHGRTTRVAGTLLPLPDDPAFTMLEAAWPEYQRLYPNPRSYWLGRFEDILRTHYPTASSDSITLTARSHAPFPLMLPGVP